jgi:hypothetical protein
MEYRLIYAIVLLLTGCTTAQTSQIVSEDYQTVVVHLNRMYDTDNFAERKIKKEGAIIPDLSFQMGITPPSINMEETVKGQKFVIVIHEAPRKIFYETVITATAQDHQTRISIHAVRKDGLLFPTRKKGLEQKRLEEIIRQLEVSE